jgi:hypothetical protein
MPRVLIHWKQTSEPGLFQVVGYADGRKQLDTHYRLQSTAALRGMIAHDLTHVTLGVAFSIDDEATIRCAKQDLRQLERVARATKALLEGKNVVLR